MPIVRQHIERLSRKKEVKKKICQKKLRDFFREIIFNLFSTFPNSVRGVFTQPRAALVDCYTFIMLQKRKKKEVFEYSQSSVACLASLRAHF